MLGAGSYLVPWQSHGCCDDAHVLLNSLQEARSEAHGPASLCSGEVPAPALSEISIERSRG